jgi:hypothetical protein
MIKLKTSFSGIKKSNLVFLLEKPLDIKKINFLKLDEKIINKIEETIKKAKNIKLSFFI